MMVNVDDIVILLSKHKFGIELYPDESGTLEAWLTQSENHRSFFDSLNNDAHWKETFPEGLPKDRTGTIERIRMALYEMNSLPVLTQHKHKQSQINNGSANAFEATENPLQYEKDVRDEDIDEVVK